MSGKRVVEFLGPLPNHIWQQIVHNRKQHPLPLPDISLVAASWANIKLQIWYTLDLVLEDDETLCWDGKAQFKKIHHKVNLNKWLLHRSILPLKRSAGGAVARLQHVLQEGAGEEFWNRLKWTWPFLSHKEFDKYIEMCTYDYFLSNLWHVDRKEVTLRALWKYFLFRLQNIYA